MTAHSAPAIDHVTVTVNGEPRALPAGTTLRQLISDITGHALGADGSREDGGRLGIAAADAGVVVPRSRWNTHMLAPSAEIEVVTAVQGG